MKTVANPFRGLAWVLGIPAILCLAFIGLIVVGMCFGVDPLDQGVQKDLVSALIGSQRLGDDRLFIYVENQNECSVAVDLTVRAADQQNILKELAIHTVLGRRSDKRIYSRDPKERFSEILSVAVTKTN